MDRESYYSQRSAVSVNLAQGQCCRVVDSEGGQVIDTWAFNQNNFDEYLSMEHSRSANYRILFKPGDVLVSNHFEPMLALTEDTSPGIHDTLHAAYSAASNKFYGASQLRLNCQGNLAGHLALQGVELAHIPCPWNLFEHAVVKPGGSLVDEVSAAKSGDYVELEAKMDLISVCSASPSVVGLISRTEPRSAAIDII